MANEGVNEMMQTYEQRLDRDGRWALSEGSRYFEGQGAVQDALSRITGRLSDLGLPYAIAGGMALFKHGYRRFTEDVDILVTDASLKVIHERLDGLGYLPPFKDSKNLRDTEFGVRIEFLIAGEYPGDGKPKPVAFPDPTEAAVEIEGISCLQLPKLVELKLASGMTGGIHRLRDFTDIVALIDAKKLPREFADQLNDYVRSKYFELWDQVQIAPKGPEAR